MRRSPEYQAKIDAFNTAHPFSLYLHLTGAKRRHYFGRFATAERADAVGREMVGTVIAETSHGQQICRRYVVVDERPAAAAVAA